MPKDKQKPKRHHLPSRPETHTMQQTWSGHSKNRKACHASSDASSSFWQPAIQGFPEPEVASAPVYLIAPAGPIFHEFV